MVYVHIDFTRGSNLRTKGVVCLDKRVLWYQRREMPMLGQKNSHSMEDPKRVPLK